MSSQDRANRRCTLTERHLEVLALASEGLTSAEIAARLGNSKHTVDNMLSNQPGMIFDRLGVAGRVNAILWYRRWKEGSNEGDRFYPDVKSALGMEHSDQPPEWIDYYEMGVDYYQHLRHQDAIDAFEGALSLARGVGNLGAEMAITAALALPHRELNREDAALHLVDSALAAMNIGPLPPEPSPWEAKSLCDRIRKTMGDLGVEAFPTLIRIQGNIHLDRRHFSAARESFKLLHPLGVVFKRPSIQAAALHFSALTDAEDATDVARVGAHLRTIRDQALLASSKHAFERTAILRDSNDSIAIGHDRRQQLKTCWLLGLMQEARKLEKEAEVAYGQSPLHACLLLDQAWWARGAGDFRSATRRLAQASRGAWELRSPHLLSSAMSCLGEIHLEQSHHKEARDHFACALLAWPLAEDGTVLPRFERIAACYYRALDGLGTPDADLRTFIDLTRVPFHTVRHLPHITEVHITRVAAVLDRLRRRPQRRS